MALKYRKKNDTGAYVFASVMGLITFLLSASVMPFLAGAKNLPAPDLMLALVCALSVLLPVRHACIFAVIFGFVADIFIYAPTAFSPIVYLAAVLIVPNLLRFFTRHGTVIIAVCSVPAILLRCVVRMFATAAEFAEPSFLQIARDSLVYTFLFTFACVIVICFICRLFIRKIKNGSGY